MAKRYDVEKVLDSLDLSDGLKSIDFLKSISFERYGECIIFMICESGNYPLFEKYIGYYPFILRKEHIISNILKICNIDFKMKFLETRSQYIMLAITHTRNKHDIDCILKINYPLYFSDYFGVKMIEKDNIDMLKYLYEKKIIKPTPETFKYADFKLRKYMIDNTEWKQGFELILNNEYDEKILEYFDRKEKQRKLLLDEALKEENLMISDLRKICQLYMEEYDYEYLVARTSILYSNRFLFARYLYNNNKDKFPKDYQNGYVL